MPPGARRTHKCPGCHEVDVPHSMLSCRPCWFRLPVAIRTAIKESYRKGAAGADEHFAAVRDAYEWYRQNTSS